MLDSTHTKDEAKTKKPYLEARNITKIFPGVIAVDNVNLKVYPGEIHAIIGENGAGKSTFCNIITGVYRPTKGEIYCFGNKVDFSHPSEAIKTGIGMVYQERNLISFLTGAQNICLGNEPNRLSIIDEDKLFNLADKIRRKLNVNICLNIPVERLTPGVQQMIEIIRAFYYKPKILILDEPTASLGEEEVKPFLNFIQQVTDEMSISVIFISHKLDEVFQIADTISVFTEGKKVFTKAKFETNQNECIKAMLRKEIGNAIKVNSIRKKKDAILEVGECEYDGKIHNLNFKVHRGEVVGFYGLVGSGRTECVEAIYGIRPVQTSNIKLDGHKIINQQPSDMLKKGVVLVPEYKNHALFSAFSLKKNMSVLFLENISSNFGLIDQKKEEKLAFKLANNGNVKYESIDQNINSLSGGNKQKAIIARSLGLLELNLIIMDEPTKGIDIGAKNEIYLLVRKLAEKDNKAVLIITSELPELLNISDRIYIFYDENIVKEFKRNEFDRTKILKHTLGG
jgi:ABC-type sugar transport system ATPase subunit